MVGDFLSHGGQGATRPTIGTTNDHPDQQGTTMNNTISYDADLRAAQRNFAEKVRGLDPRLMRLQLLALANKQIGTGTGQVDPLTQSFSQQALDILTAKDGIERVEQSIAELSSRRDSRLPEGDRLVQLKQLATERDMLKIKVITAAERNHASAADAARTVFAQRDAESAKVVAIRAAAQARADATILETDPLVENLANVLIEGRRAI